MSQPPPPAPYHTSEHVRNGISIAQSSVNNPRGLEKMWNGPYNQILHEITTSYRGGEFIVYSPYTLWLPSMIREEQALKKKFEAEGMDYDDLSAPDQDVAPGEGNTFQEVTVEPVQGSLRKSGRVAMLKDQADEAKLKEHLERMKQLCEMRTKLLKKQEDSFKAAEITASHGNMSLESANSKHEAGAVDEEPDIFVSHVATVRISKPTTPESTDHYRNRAGRKVFHQCGAVIVELKRGPSRLQHGDKRNLAIAAQIAKSQNDLLEYCSAYFASYPDAKSVIALAAAGQYWKWANIQRQATPEWDWDINIAKSQGSENKKAFNNWHTRFSRVTFTLGTKDSDRQMTLINELHIHRLLVDGHTPDVGSKADLCDSASDIM